ncbi:1-acylglycerol-3-phosphate O-acyltransferase [Theileria orientalis]|uniref:1-acylglycerol-3-phosphate O-acyltransferase n=1 Tax=Theileria orientalis TaxID=68886 RepID=A0A976QUH4_THEOR|nr:1-acylglycerol-3-phosphate O-acyltransferase [Theileria orientalis]
MNKLKYCIHGAETLFLFILIAISVVSVVAFYINRHWKCVILTDIPERDRKKRKIYMFNHIKITDPFVSTFVGMKSFTGCLYKDSLHKGYPQFLLNLIGQVPIYFEYDKAKGTKTVKKECVVGVMDRCKQLMDNGFDIIVYPEGTRNKTGKLLEFKDGFFRFSIDNDFEIVPCAVHNTQKMVDDRVIVLDATCYLMAGKPISPKGKTVEDLKFEVRKSIYKLMKLAPTFNPELETVEELE